MKSKAPKGKKSIFGIIKGSPLLSVYWVFFYSLNSLYNFCFDVHPLDLSRKFWILTKYNYSRIISKLKKGIFWLIGIFIIGIILLDIFFFLKLYLGMVIVILGIVVFIQRAFEKPKKIACKISKDGIVLKDRVYSYSVFKSFWISQRQPQKLYLQQTRRFLPALTILITGESDEKISFFLSQYLPKLRTTSEDFADRLASLLKFWIWLNLFWRGGWAAESSVLLRRWARKGSVSSNLTLSAFGPPKRTYGLATPKLRQGERDTVRLWPDAVKAFGVTQSAFGRTQSKPSAWHSPPLAGRSQSLRRDTVRQ